MLFSLMQRYNFFVKYIIFMVFMDASGACRGCVEVCGLCVEVCFVGVDSGV